jgi:iron complex outermembrane receptor protein
MSKPFWMLTTFLCGAFALDASAEDAPITTLETVLVTAPLQQNAFDVAMPATVLEGDELRRKLGRSIGDTLKDELGISSQSFGPGVGTPVIRGQAGPRVRVLANGVGGNDVSAISPDHASSVEPLLAEKIEVLRGPATLLYGSGAIGGIVNVIDNRIPSSMADKLVGGAVEQRYDSASDETGTALKVEGGAGSVAYHLDGFYRERNNLDIGGRGIDVDAVGITDPSLSIMQNPKGSLPNTWGHAVSGSAGFSWIGEPGFAGVGINRLENKYGIAPNGTGEEFVQIDLKQSKYDFKSELTAPFGFAKSLRTRLGYTDYQHTEIANGEPGAFFTNKTFEGRMELAHQDIGPWHGVVGFQAISSDFSAIEKLTGEAIVPRSQSNSYGVFGLESVDVGPLTYQLGLRIEAATVAPEAMKGLGYTPVSASTSALWKVDDRNSLNLAVTRSSRAPQVQELLSNGFHDATRSYEVGSVDLQEETSYNLDLGYRFKSDWMRAKVDLFHNWAVDYIYQQRTGRFVDEAGNPCAADCVPIVQTRQGDAIFKGYEARLIFPVMENRYGMLDVSVFSDYTRGEFVNGGDAPRMPPLRYGLQLDHELGHWSNYLRLMRAESQDRPGDHETPTAGYLMLNLGTQYRVEAFEGGELIAFAKVNNLLDETVRYSTSYLRNFAPEAGRGGEVGFRVSY